MTALVTLLAFAAAALAGRLAERAHLPRVTGYLVCGMAFGPHALNVLPRETTADLQIVNGLAVSLIAFIAGLELNLRRLRPQLPAMLKAGGIVLAAMYLGLFAICWLAWPTLGIAPDLAGWQKAAVAALLTAVLASFSPTITIAIITETRAEGPLARLTLAVVILADLALILLFSLFVQLTRQALGSGGRAHALVSVSWEILGSLAIGAGAGLLFAAYLRRARRELPVTVLVFCAAIAAAGGAWGTEPLLTALAAGLAAENVETVAARGDALAAAIKRSSVPVFVVFFTVAGASLRLDALPALGWIATGLCLARIALLVAGTWLARIWLAAGAAADGRMPVGLLWMGLVSQAGVTLGLTLIVAREFPAWGPAVQTLMVSLIVLHELIGPVLFRTALARAGEIGGADRRAVSAAWPA